GVLERILLQKELAYEVPQARIDVLRVEVFQFGLEDEAAQAFLKRTIFVSGYEERRLWVVLLPKTWRKDGLPETREKSGLGIEGFVLLNHH
ncbi:MAG: hypothetical protein ABR978_06430, partial [Dehalococcoidia bacterium]